MNLMELDYASVMFNLYVVSEVLTLLENLIRSSYHPSVVRFIYLLSERYKREQRYDILQKIHEKVIKDYIFRQLTCKASLPNTLELLRFYVFGFTTVSQLQKQNLNDILKALRFYKPHEAEARAIVEFLVQINEQPLLV